MCKAEDYDVSGKWVVTFVQHVDDACPMTCVNDDVKGTTLHVKANDSVIGSSAREEEEEEEKEKEAQKHDTQQKQGLGILSSRKAERESGEYSVLLIVTASWV